MENTVKNKAKFFAQYYGQYIGYNPLYNKDKRYVEQNFLIMSGIGSASYIKLRPLSSITDEDMLKISSIVVNREVNADIVRWDWRIYIVTKKENSEIDESILLEWTICLDIEDCKVRFVINHITNNQTGINNAECPNILHVYDYLRSKGYALPWMGLSVEEQVKYGWVKLV